MADAFTKIWVWPDFPEGWLTGQWSASRRADRDNMVPYILTTEHERLLAEREVEISQARGTAEYWKAEHLAGNNEIVRLRAALEWYGEQARLARLIHSEGDSGRHALASDGGRRARAALGDDNG